MKLLWKSVFILDIWYHAACITTLPAFSLSALAQDNHRWLCANRQNESILAGQRAPIRIKDRQYYKKLLDRYFGHNHALANENITKTEKNASRSGHNRYGNNYDSSVFFHAREDPNRQFPQVRLSYSTNDRKVVLTHQPFTQDDIENEELFDLEVCNQCCDWLSWCELSYL